MDLLQKPPPGVPDADVAGGFALLPQQSEKQLQLSEVHSRLDRVLKFLQRDVGYCFAADAKPQHGGAVQLQDPAKAIPPPWRNSSKAARLPTEAPSQAPPGQEPAVTYRTHAGPLDPRRLDAEFGEYRIGPDAARYAHFPDDLVLVSRFARLLVQGSPGFADRAREQVFFKSVLQGVRLMHLCEFPYSDVVITLAYASCYFRTTFKSIGHMMSEAEAANVITLLIFLAHSFVLDETCPLRCWQKHIFKKYCTLKVLDAALFRLFNLRGFQLRLTPEEEGRALHGLLVSASGDDNWDGTARLNEAAAAALRDRLLKGAKVQGGHALPQSAKVSPSLRAAAAGSPKRGDAAGGPGGERSRVPTPELKGLAKPPDIALGGGRRRSGDRPPAGLPAPRKASGTSPETGAGQPKNGVRPIDALCAPAGHDLAGGPGPGVSC